MNISIPSFLFFSIPSLIYWYFSRRKGLSNAEALLRLGWVKSPVRYYWWAVGLGVFFAVVGSLVFYSGIIPQDFYKTKGTGAAYYATWHVGVRSFLLALLREAIVVTLGEEIFFRGFLGGLLMRKFGFVRGNLAQLLLFLLPHLPIVFLLSARIWPLAILSVVSFGWISGWLRHRSNSILPGWVMHSLGNATGALLSMSH